MKKYVRAEVSKEFVDAMVEIAQARIRNFIEVAEYSMNKQLILHQKAPAIAKLRRLKTREGRDYEITRLRGLDYVGFGVVERNDKRYLVAKTKDITLTLWKRSKPGPSAPRWDMGPYIIYIELEGLKNGLISNPHFIPLRSPLTENRHPHHKARPSSPNWPYDPLQFVPSTCWGSFGPIVSDCAKNGDIVELFRAFHAYLSRYDSGSPLAGGIEYCTFAKGVANAHSYCR